MCIFGGGGESVVQPGNFLSPEGANAADDGGELFPSRAEIAEAGRLAEEQWAAERAAEAEQQRIAAERAARIGQGRTRIDDAFAPFDAGYYNTLSQSYNDYATHDLNQQYQNQLGSLISALTRAGSVNSAARSRGVDALRSQYDEAMSRLPGRANEIVNTMRSGVDTARSGLYAQNEADPGVDSIASAARSQAAGLQAPRPFSPLAALMIDPAQFAVGMAPGGARAAAGGSRTPTLFNQSRQSRGGGYAVA